MDSLFQLKKASSKYIFRRGYPTFFFHTKNFKHNIESPADLSKRSNKLL